MFGRKGEHVDKPRKTFPEANRLFGVRNVFWSNIGNISINRTIYRSESDKRARNNSRNAKGKKNSTNARAGSAPAKRAQFFSIRSNSSTTSSLSGNSSTEPPHSYRSPDSLLCEILLKPKAIALAQKNNKTERSDHTGETEIAKRYSRETLLRFARSAKTTNK